MGGRASDWRAGLHRAVGTGLNAGSPGCWVPSLALVPGQGQKDPGPFYDCLGYPVSRDCVNWGEGRNRAPAMAPDAQGRLLLPMARWHS